MRLTADLAAARRAADEYRALHGQEFARAVELEESLEARFLRTCLSMRVGGCLN